VSIHSPVDDTVARLFEERHRPRGDLAGGGVPAYSGHQVQIRVAGNDALRVVLYHVTPAPGVAEGMDVRAGQLLGHANVQGNSFDIGVERWEGNSPRYYSYLALLPERQFADYRRRGLDSPADLIISEEYRRAHPLAFNSPEAHAEGWVRLR